MTTQTITVGSKVFVHLAFHHVLKHMQAVEEMKERGLIGTPDSTLFSPWAVKGRDGNHKLGGL